MANATECVWIPMSNTNLDIDKWLAILIKNPLHLNILRRRLVVPMPEVNLSSIGFKLPTVSVSFFVWNLTIQWTESFWMSNGILFAIPIDFHFSSFKLLKSEREKHRERETEKVAFRPQCVWRSLQIVKELKIQNHLFHNFQVNRKKNLLIREKKKNKKDGKILLMESFGMMSHTKRKTDELSLKNLSNSNQSVRYLVFAFWNVVSGPYS